MDGQVHIGGVAEGVVGALDLHELDYVRVREGAGLLDGDVLVLGAMDEQDVVRPVEVLELPDVVCLEVVDQRAVDLEPALKADLDLFALLEFGEVRRRDILLHVQGHHEARRARYDAGEGVAEGMDIGERQVSAEAHGIVEDGCGAQRVSRVAHGEPQVLEALGKLELLARVLAMAGPVEGEHGVALVLAGLLLGELLDPGDVLVAAVAVCADDHAVVRAGVGAAHELAAHAVAVLVDIEVFSDHDSPHGKTFSIPYLLCRVAKLGLLGA